MQRTSTVIWTVVGAVAAVLVVLGLIYGPGLYREGRALVDPIVELSKSDDRLAELDASIPFTAPADGTISEDRLEVFLAVRRELLPHYLEWQRLEKRLDRTGSEDWDTAKEVLGLVREVAGAQVAALRNHGMSRAEFNWIEDLVYTTWFDAVDQVIVRDEVVTALRSTATQDLEFLGEVERRYGSSPATHQLGARLEARIADLEEPELPPIDGVSADTSLLLWRHRAELAELDLDRYSELHEMLRGKDVNIELGSQ